MKKRYLWNMVRAKTAALLICTLIFQDFFFAFADTNLSYERESAVGEETFKEEGPESENTSFVSFPSRFSDSLEEGYDEHYYVFTLDSVTDISVSVESDDRSCQYGAELLDSGFVSISISERKSGQRITEKSLPAGTYFLRVFPLSDNTWEPYAVSIQKLKLSKAEVEKVDFSEMHMVGTLQGDGSPYRLNGTDPSYVYEYKVIDPALPACYRWYKLDEPVYGGRGVDHGGIYPFPQSYYASWLGPVAEDAHPMSEVNNFEGSTYEEFLAYQAYLQNKAIAYRKAEPQVHVQNSIALPARYTGYENNGEGIENPDWEAHIKAGIMNYGALTTGIYWSGLDCEDQKNYYYSGWDFTTVEGPEGEDIKVLKNMLPDNHSQNHEVVVVGWDDNYDRENFLYDIDAAQVIIMNEASDVSSNSDAEKAVFIEGFEKGGRASKKVRATDSEADPKYSGDERGPEGKITRDEVKEDLLPDRDGAWIIRNSWGKASGDEGYYYVSYCDKQLFGIDNTWAYTATETTGNYNKLYEITSLPYSRQSGWITNGDYMMASTVFTADEDGADVLKAVNFVLINNNIRYKIAVNRGEDIGKGWLEKNIYASGSKLYAGYYTVRLDKSVILEPGEPFEIILRIEGSGDETLTLPFVANDSLVANIPRKAGICHLYDPMEGDKWIDIGDDFVADEYINNNSNNYYGYFAIKALCNDTTLEDGVTERISLLDIDPDTYFAYGGMYSESVGTESTASAGRSQTDDESSDVLLLRDGHVLRRRDSSEPFVLSSELPEPDTVFPEDFDLRKEGVLTPVKDQAMTNTCWSFGSTAAAESSYLLNGSNLYDFNYSSGISLETKLPVTEEGTVIYSFDKEDASETDDALFTPKLLSWDDGPIDDADGELRWELSGDLSSVDMSAFNEETGGTGLTENGEEVLLFTPKESGMVTVKVSSADDPTKTASCRVMLLEEDPVDSIKLSPDSLRLKAGQSYQLDVVIEAPEESEAKPVFSSDNPNIATVDDKGIILGVMTGTTVIRVRAGGEEASCIVTVWKPGKSTGGSGRDIGYSGDNSAVRGSWTVNPDGSWSFSAGGNAYKDTWGYVYNPYGASGAGEAGWFYFDSEGRMLTGLFRDKDGRLYYLNPTSDGSLGKMLTGWHWIPDSSGMEYCYYFHTEEGGPMGAMVTSGVTPDGYEVDSEGRWCINGIPQAR
ncbi:MAG: C1 family peptidase [Candidatus Avilachnospira sp.]|jgi:C1A family cysteine protease